MQARLPQNGELITFEHGDGRNYTQALTLLVALVRPGRLIGDVVLVGWQIEDGKPTGRVALDVSVATVEKRYARQRSR